MGWRMFAGANIWFWGHGTVKALVAGRVGDAFDIVSVLMGTVAAYGLLLYALRRSAGGNRDFWGRFCTLFIVWTLLCIGLMLVRTRAMLIAPMGIAAAATLILFILGYAYFQGLALYRLSQAD